MAETGELMGVRHPNLPGQKIKGADGMVMTFRSILLDAAHSKTERDEIKEKIKLNEESGNLQGPACRIMMNIHSQYSDILDSAMCSIPGFGDLPDGAKRMYFYIKYRKGVLVKKSAFLDLSDNLSKDSKDLDIFLQSTGEDSFISIRGRGYRYSSKGDNQKFQMFNPEITREESGIRPPFISQSPPVYGNGTIKKESRPKNKNPNHKNFHCSIDDLFSPNTVGGMVLGCFLCAQDRELSISELATILNVDNTYVSAGIGQIQTRLTEFDRKETLNRESRSVYKFSLNNTESK